MKKEISTEAYVLLRDEHEKEMYEKLDALLGISRRYSRKGVIFTRICFCAAFLLAAAACLFIMNYTENKTIPIVLTVTSLLGIPSILLFYGNKPFPGYERFKTIISEDGIAKVFYDSENVRRIKGSNICVGREYIFDKSGSLYRRSDVAKVIMSEIRIKGMTNYYAEFELSGSAGGNVYISTLSTTDPGKRLREYSEIREIFGK